MALGYGAGWEKFIAMIRVYEMDPYEVLAGSVTPGQTQAFLDWLGYLEKKDKIAEFAKKDERTQHMWVQSWLQVNDFRANSPLITGLWKTCHTDLVTSANHKENFKMTLPSGRVMEYFRPILRGRELLTKFIQGEDYKYIYGGKVVENACQAIARDIFAQTHVRHAAAGHSVIWTVYDEWIFESPKNEAEDRAEDIARITREQPEWVRCPVGVDTKIVDHYLK